MGVSQLFFFDDCTSSGRKKSIDLLASHIDHLGGIRKGNYNVQCKLYTRLPQQTKGKGTTTTTTAAAAAAAMTSSKAIAVSKHSSNTMTSSGDKASAKIPTNASAVVDGSSNSSDSLLLCRMSMSANKCYVFCGGYLTQAEHGFEDILAKITSEGSSVNGAAAIAACSGNASTAMAGGGTIPTLRKITKVEGISYICGDFAVRIGSVFLGTAFSRLLLEVEYLPCVDECACSGIIGEFVEATICSCHGIELVRNATATSVVASPEHGERTASHQPLQRLTSNFTNAGLIADSEFSLKHTAYLYMTAISL